jgi:hypothetical protein
MSNYPYMSAAHLAVRLNGLDEIVTLSGQEAQFVRLALRAGERGFTFGEAVPGLGGYYPNLKGIKDRLKKRGILFRGERVSGHLYFRFWFDVEVEVVCDEGGAEYE